MTLCRDTLLLDCPRLSPAAHSVCGDKKVVLTEEKSVSGEVFENLTSGGIIDVGPGSGSGRRKRDSELTNCSITVLHSLYPLTILLCAP